MDSRPMDDDEGEKQIAEWLRLHEQQIVAAGGDLVALQEVRARAATLRREYHEREQAARLRAAARRPGVSGQ